MAGDKYTFGDNRQASARLRRLAELYESETRDLLQRGGVHAPPLAIDLGCGPGWSTRLIHDVLNPGRTVGLDSSERYIEEARGNHGLTLEFQVHDVARTPFPVPAPNVLFCRFLLTHLRSIGDVLAGWANIAGPCALLFVHETESMEAEHPTLRRYYELVAQLQHHYDQTLLVGAILEASFENSGWRLVESERRILEKPADQMAEIHLANLRTWRHDEYASRFFDSSEIDSMEASMDRIVRGIESGGVVVNAARQIIAQRLYDGRQVLILQR
jgi:trans-aconitate 2-methyltransferase